MQYLVWETGVESGSNTHSNSNLATSKPTTTSAPALVKGNTMHPGFDFYFNRLFPILLASIGGMTQVHLTCFY